MRLHPRLPRESEIERRKILRIHLSALRASGGKIIGDRIKHSPKAAFHGAIASMKQQTRGSFIAGMGAAVFASATSARAQSSAAPALPLKNLGLEHLDIVVPDTAISAKFYMQVFRTKLHQQPFQGNIRYFILLGDLPANRQVGYIAIGAAGNRPTSIGHYCALAERYDRNAVAREMEAAGYKTAQGGFGMWPDPDGLELQLFQPPAGLVTAAVPSDLPIETNGANGLVVPL